MSSERITWRLYQLVVATLSLLFVHTLVQSWDDTTLRFRHKLISYAPVRNAPMLLHHFNANTTHSTLSSALRSDRDYVYFPQSGGHSNQFFTQMRALYIGHLLNRTVIVPPFVRDLTHSAASSPEFTDFSAIYTLPFAPSIGFDQARVHSMANARESMSCWTRAEQTLRSSHCFDLHAFAMPAWGRGSYESLALLNQNPKDLVLHLDRLNASSGTARPNAKLLCVLDGFAFHSAALIQSEHRYIAPEELHERDPAWLDIGQHLAFTAMVRLEAAQVVRDAFGSWHARYVAIHIRRGDFCRYGRVNCSQSHADFLTPFQRAVARLQVRGCVETRSLPKVLVGTDESDPGFLDAIEALGWTPLSLVKAHREHDKLDRGILTAAIFARAHAFVGTSQSTMSALAQRRVGASRSNMMARMSKMVRMLNDSLEAWFCIVAVPAWLYLFMTLSPSDGGAISREEEAIRTLSIFQIGVAVMVFINVVSVSKAYMRQPKRLILALDEGNLERGEKPSPEPHFEEEEEQVSRTELGLEGVAIGCLVTAVFTHQVLYLIGVFLSLDVLVGLRLGDMALQSSASHSLWSPTVPILDDVPVRMPNEPQTCTLARLLH
ncbi:uncharacterized protein L969DRAFT_15849 [Mixia osmundae IAM 14324]|uniref:uncharacterized protein n=1 Tax=Mixia osmundae (strain CBS 9802 / IAM 14324 / JCM 22182 / KY 12970) TaxID=764103 RepID=UPI0004A546A1|nr:uncharacterized protein L969DRAFT_15849 [Mixia osmundae IAM 14324]KEI40490.1 hypothetical protein L969DRAFT_15849 [Mixia osmundae IAM 14324]